MATKKTTTKKATAKKPKAAVKNATVQERKYYILANGEGTRWHNYKGVPKQLIEIDGETILSRMVRLLRAEGVKAENIFICGPYSDPNAKSVITNSKTKREVFEEVAELAKSPFVILYGDCYYTEACIKEIVKRPIKKYDEFFTTEPNPNTGCLWPEGYAHRCEDWEWWRDTMHEINTNPELINTPKDWFIHWWLLGVRDERINMPPIANFNPDHDIAWCDQTDDFDYPEDLAKFCATTGRKCTNKPLFTQKERQDYLSIIIPAYNAKDSLKRLLDGLIAQRYNNGQTAEIIVINDGSTDGTAELLASYGNSIRSINQENKGVSAARNLGLEISTGKYISFVDADDIVSDRYIRDVTNDIKDDYCDFVTYPWAKTGTEEIYFDVFDPIPSAAVWAYVFKWETIGDEHFREDWQIGEDLDWLKRVLPGKRKKFSDKIVYTYNWNANPESLSKQYNRGDIKQERA